MEDHLKKNEKNEDNLQKKWRQPQKRKEKKKKWRRPQKKWKNEDDLNKKYKTNLFSIPLKFRGKHFLGLAQLSKIFKYKIGLR